MRLSGASLVQSPACAHKIVGVHVDSRELRILYDYQTGSKYGLSNGDSIQQSAATPAPWWQSTGLVANEDSLFVVDGSVYREVDLRSGDVREIKPPLFRESSKPAIVCPNGELIFRVRRDATPEELVVHPDQKSVYGFALKKPGESESRLVSEIPLAIPDGIPEASNNYSAGLNLAVDQNYLYFTSPLPKPFWSRWMAGRRRYHTETGRCTECR